jgi:hypothetical protein
MNFISLFIFAPLLIRLLPGVVAIENVTVVNNDTKGDTTIQIGGEEEIHMYDETDIAWIPEAIVNVAYYLRSHKFNEWDRRFVLFLKRQRLFCKTLDFAGLTRVPYAVLVSSRI